MSFKALTQLHNAIFFIYCSKNNKLRLDSLSKIKKKTTEHESL